MVGDDRDEEGQYTEVYTDEDFLNAVEELEVASTQNIADIVGCSYNLAYRRLKDLQDDEKVDSQEVRNAFIWIRS